jgi:membrane protein DedA with SNARE-associated domain
MSLPPLEGFLAAPGAQFLSRLVDVPALLSGMLAAYDRFGYLLVFAGAWLEHSVLLGVLVPGGTLVSVGGAAARLGTLQLPLTIALAALGMLVGAVTDYWLGRSGLTRMLLRSRLGPRLQPRLDRAAALLRRHGWWAITLVHALGAGRSAMAVTAGTCRMPFWRFVACEVPAALLWSTLFNLLGYGVATNLDLIRQVLQRAGVAIALVIAAVFVLRWALRRRVPPTPGAVSPPPAWGQGLEGER